MNSSEVSKIKKACSIADKIIKKLLKQLKQNNIKVALISSSKNCLPILKKVGIDNLFEVIITGHDIKKGKYT